MSNKQSQWPFEDAADLSADFSEVTRNPARQQSEHSSNGVSETASAEIENRFDHDNALGKHNQRWQKERDKLAHGPALDLEPVGMGTNPRELQDEYTKRRGQWEQDRDGINKGFEEAHNMIRSEGTTLSDAFADTCDVELDTGPDLDQGPGMDADNGGGRSM